MNNEAGGIASSTTIDGRLQGYEAEQLDPADRKQHCEQRGKLAR